MWTLLIWIIIQPKIHVDCQDRLCCMTFNSAIVFSIKFCSNAGLEGDASGRSKQTRSEKKSRKAMLKLRMKYVTGVSYWQSRRARMLVFDACIYFKYFSCCINICFLFVCQILFVLSKPDVFKSPTSHTYIIYLGKLSLKTWAQSYKLKAPNPTNAGAKPKSLRILRVLGCAEEIIDFERIDSVELIFG